MSLTTRKLFKTAILAIVFVILAGCNPNSQLDGRVDAQGSPTISAWLAYWELDAGEKDLKKLKKLDKLAYFGAYFDRFDRIFIPQELSDKKRELTKAKGKFETYLTFVNDKQHFDGSITLKDIELLRRQFSSETNMETHIDQIIAMTLRDGYDGVEIDYERIWKDDKVGQAFGRFVDKLYTKTQKNNLKLRIVLEPSTPFAAVSFPKGPEYVVMLYNLYGIHSEPGPKANKEFIEKTVARMKALPGEKAVAFSTGGCLWGDNDKRRYLTEVEAKTLAATYEAEPKRDRESQCLFFQYSDGGAKYQVWYADAETLNYWIAIVRGQGINNISLWRLGGNINIHNLK